MNREEQKRIYSRLLAARGWISCWLPPAGNEVDDDAILHVRAGPLKSAIMAIDEAKKALRH